MKRLRVHLEANMKRLLVELSTGPFDPYKIFILVEPRNQPRKA